MSESWSAPETWTPDVHKYVPEADDGVIKAIVRYCGIALRSRDASLVSFGDPEETGRVRENFLKKKLGLTLPDEKLDEAIAAVGERMRESHFKNRVTVYYLLLTHFGLVQRFGGGAGDSHPDAAAVEAPAHEPPAASTAGAAALGGAGLAAAGLAAVESHVHGAEPPPPAPPPPAPPPTPPAPPPANPAIGGVAAAGLAAGAAGLAAGAVGERVAAIPRPVGGFAPPDEGPRKSGLGWWPWLILALLVAALLLWLLLRNHPAAPAATPIPAPAAAPAALPAPSAPADISAAPAEGSVAIPSGAGVTVETRDGKPVVKVYFDTGKTDVAPAFADSAAGLKAYLDGHAGSSLAVAGFNDNTGNAALNAELSKNRAKAVKDALVAAGIPDGSIALVKPAEATDTTGANAGARRTEVTVR